MADRENTIDVLVERIEQVFNKVSDIDTKMDKHTDSINDINIKLALDEQRMNTIENNLKEQKTNTDYAKRTAIGAIITVVTGVIVAFVRLLIGA